MKELYTDVREITKKKNVIIPVCVIAFLCYLYLWTHPSMGVDDTAVYRYMVEGFAPHLGRWTLFLLNKVAHIAEFTPVVTDVLGVIFMVLSGLIICVILQKSSGGRIRTLPCTIFVCFMISYPLIDEVYVYYLHNGIGLAYLLTAAAYYLVRFRDNWKNRIAAGILLMLALACYETFAEVFLLLFFIDALIRLYVREEGLTFRKLCNLFIWCCVLIIGAMICRDLINRVILAVIDVEPYFHSIIKSIGWIFSEGALEQLISMIRGFARYYILNATVNFGVFMFWVAMAVIAVFCIALAVRRRSILPVVCLAGAAVVPWAISIIEGNAGAYRTMQTFPVLVGFAMLLLCERLMEMTAVPLLRNIGFVLLALLLYNQVYETNKWYYVDYMKYEEEVSVCRQMAYDIQKEATVDKPIIFVGRISEYGTADTYMYVKQGTWQYRLFSYLDGNADPDEYRKYEIVQNPAWYSVFDWGVDAFDEHATEIANFFAYHGYQIQVASRDEKEEMEYLAEDMPVWPKEGSILELDDYVIVKLGDTQE